MFIIRNINDFNAGVVHVITNLQQWRVSCAVSVVVVVVEVVSGRRRHAGVWIGWTRETTAVQKQNYRCSCRAALSCRHRPPGGRDRPPASFRRRRRWTRRVLSWRWLISSWESTTSTIIVMTMVKMMMLKQLSTGCHVIAGISGLRTDITIRDCQNKVSRVQKTWSNL